MHVERRPGRRRRSPIFVRRRRMSKGEIEGEDFAIGAGYLVAC